MAPSAKPIRKACGFADKASMAINAVGTNAVGDYLASEVANTRVLFGLAPQTDAQAAAPVPSTSGSPPATLTRTQLQTEVLAQEVANTQTLFGIGTSSSESPAGLAPDAAETPGQQAFVAMQSSLITSEFSNVATLFGSIGLGNNTDSNA